MIAGIDPGKRKIGFALAEKERLIFSAIIPAGQKAALTEAIRSGLWHPLETWRKEGSAVTLPRARPEGIYIGNGTSSAEFRAALPFDYIVVEEYGTTLEARKIYWQLYPPRGLAKVIPLSLRTPPRELDDLAAYAILTRGKNAARPGERYYP